MNDYEVIEPLGEGSFGRVYKAKCRHNSTIIALKVIGKRGRDAKEVKGLRRECEIQRRLDHPNIIKMLDSFETANEIFVITEFAEKTLTRLLGDVGFLPETKVQPIVWDLVSALYYLHSHRVLHRDLKPQNVLLDSKDHAKLCDFGFARNMTTGTHVLTSIKGTPLYMAPELIDEQPYDHNADLWSLGCIIYELLEGAPPFSTNSILQLIRLVKREPIQWPAYISEKCISFLKGLLQKNPARRLSWNEILNHPFVKGHILVLEDSVAKPLTRALSENTMQVKEKQRKEHMSKKNNLQLIKVANPETEENATVLASTTQDVKNNNPHLLLEKLSINDEQSSQTLIKEKLNFIEDTNPIETDEWIVFLQKSMEEVINGELMSLTQPNLTNILVSPLRNTNANPKVLSYVAKLLSIPFVIRGITDESLQQIRKVYLEVKLVPNLVYSAKLLMRIKTEVLSSPSPSTPTNTPSPLQENYKNITDVGDDDLQCLEYIFMLIAHLVYTENGFLTQYCDAMAVLNVYTPLSSLLLCKNRSQMVADLLAILTRVLRVFPENIELIEKIIFNDNGDSKINFVELLRHNEALMRERACFFLLFIGKLFTTKKMAVLWNETVRETIEALMYDSIESVRNAADRAVTDLKEKEFYKQSD